MSYYIDIKPNLKEKNKQLIPYKFFILRQNYVGM